MGSRARSEILVDPGWVVEHADDPAVRIIDCAGTDAYERAHIPGSVGLSAHPWLKEPEQDIHVMGPASFAEVMGRLGVGEETTVVTYDDYNMSYAARLWWVLLYYGHANTKLLNGGWRRWLSEHHPATMDMGETEPAVFTAVPNEDVLCRFEYLRRRYDDPDVQLLNVLRPEWYRGDENPWENKRVGHIPGSVNIPVESFVTDDGAGVLRSQGELESILKEAGMTRDRETIIHCQGGIWTTLAFFVLTLLGWENVRAYDAAMAEWANRDDTPLVVGD